MPANIALLGSGVFAKASYLPAIMSLHPTVLKLHSIWSRSASSAEGFLSVIQESSSTLKPELQHGDEGLESILANKEIDGVLIVLPISSQAEIIRKCWKAGKHVLSEKPIAKDTKIAKALVDEYERDYKPNGIIWRVAENYAHEPILREAGKVLANTPELGPILFWQLNFQGYIQDGSKYQSTTWRTIPDYQGGFLLDGGVHWIALLRTVLPSNALPSSIISVKSLHRTHLLPHDTLHAISLPPPSSTTDSHGPKTQVKTAEYSESDVVGGIGKSTPTGQITFSFAPPDLPPHKAVINGLRINTLNGLVEVTCQFNEETKARDFILEVTPANSNSNGNGSKFEASKSSGPMDGVEIEIKMFSNAITDAKNGKTTKEEDDYGKPRDALWDLGVLEAMLESNGKELKVESLIGK